MPGPRRAALAFVYVIAPEAATRAARSTPLLPGAPYWLAAALVGAALLLAARVARPARTPPE